MSVELITLLMFASMIGLVMTGREIFLAVGFVGTIAALILWGNGGTYMVQAVTFSLTRWYVILSFPPFIFMGYILAKSGIGDDLYEMIYRWFGHIRGGLGMGTVGICALIAAMNGTTVTGTVSMGTIALPSMLKRKYDKTLVIGLVQAGGALGYLIPPSLIFILYGMIARTSIGHLWIAGVIPGLLLALFYVVYVAIRCRLDPCLGPPIPDSERFTWRQKFASMKCGIAPIVIIFIVIGLLVMGVTTILESSAMGAISAVVCAAAYHRLSWKLVRDAMHDTWKISSIVVFLLVSALLFSAVYDGLGASKAFENIMVGSAGSGMGAIWMMMGIWMLLGMVMDDTAMLILVAPLFIPIVVDLGFNLVWFGVLHLMTVEMALLTPPFGFSLFLMRGIIPPEFRISMKDIYKSVIPFVILMVGLLGLLIAFPQLSLWLPTLLLGE